MRAFSRISMFVAVAAFIAAFAAPSVAFADEPSNVAPDAAIQASGTVVDAAPASQDVSVDSSKGAGEDILVGENSSIIPSAPAPSTETPASNEASPDSPTAAVGISESPADAAGATDSPVGPTTSSENSIKAPASPESPAAEGAESVSYRAHVEYVGWQEWVQDGELAGTSGQSLRMEAVEFALDGDYDGEIFCQAHVQYIGWQRLGGTSAGDDPAMVGTEGKGLRVEAFKFTLGGEVSRFFDIVYRAHVQYIGWQDWVQNGAIAGTSGQSLRVEALQIKLVPKSAPTEESDGNPGLVYSTHVQYIGWQNQKASGEVSGTDGQSLRMEATRIYLDPAGLDGSLEYRAHVQYIGWQDWVSSGEMIGTSGQSLRMEAFQIVLTGEIAAKYDVVYRAHVQYLGWQPWVVNGATAGTNGKSLRMEAIRISLVKKGVYEIHEGSYMVSLGNDPETLASAPSADTLTTSSYCSDQKQKFYIRDDGDGSYLIQSVDNGAFLSDAGDSIEQTPYASGNQSQLWTVIWDGGVIFTNRATGKVLSIAQDTVSSDDFASDNPSQHLVLSEVQLIQDGVYLIKSAGKNVTLDVEGASWLAGANVMVCTPNGGGNQAFMISLSDSDSYQITCAMTGKTLDVAGGSTANGANVRQWWQNGAGAQRWKASLDLDGAIQFVNVTSGHYLASEGDGSSGSNVVSSDTTAAANRKWKLEPTSYTHDSVLARAIDIAQHEGSYTDYLILVDLTNNRTVIFEWSAGEWTPIFNWVCSTGAPWSPTVLGDYEVTGKGYSFNGALGGEPYTCYYYTQFYGDYLFHSVPYHQNTWNVQDPVLGESISHGCVRLATENAKWIYDNIPYYTHVLTYY